MPRSTTCSSASIRRRTYRSARPNLAFRIWWKSRGPSVTMRAGRGPPVHDTVSPAASSPSSRPSAVSTTERSSHTLKRSVSSGVEHERAVEQHVRRHRREQEAAVARRHDRAARRERVRRGTGGRGDDHAVGGVRRERCAVHFDVEAHEPAGVHLLEHRLVEREPATAAPSPRTRRRLRAPCAPRPRSSPASSRSSAASKSSGSTSVR